MIDPRGRQDRNLPPPGQADLLAVPEDRGQQVHRSRLRGPRRRVDDRDLVRISVDMVKQEKIDEIREKAKSNVEEKVLDLLLPPSRRKENALAEGDYDRFLETREKLRKQLREGVLDERLVESRSRRRWPPRSKSFRTKESKRSGSTSRRSCPVSWVGSPKNAG